MGREKVLLVVVVVVIVIAVLVPVVVSVRGRSCEPVKLCFGVDCFDLLHGLNGLGDRFGGRGLNLFNWLDGLNLRDCWDLRNCLDGWDWLNWLNSLNLLDWCSLLNSWDRGSRNGRRRYVVIVVVVEVGVKLLGQHVGGTEEDGKEDCTMHFG
jgi:hypothetical protein